ncbi:MAG: hypothetical protein ACOYMR_01575, partial [Ilumatobacteraceae bacterium]
TDGDPATAWTSPFQNAVGSALTFTTDGTPVGSFTIQQPTDALHSRISAVTVFHDGLEQRVDVATPDADGRSTVSLPSPVTGATFRVQVVAVEPAITFDRRFAEATVLPVALREVSADGVVPTRAIASTLAPGCRDDLLQVDGEPVGVQLDTATIDALRNGEPATVPTCTTVSMAVGTHRVDGTGAPGIQVDRVVLRDTVRPAEPAPAPTASVTRTRTSRTIEVGACPAGCWLIVGEGWNPAWSAAINGTDLGAPTQIAGGMNGWWVPAHDGPVTVQVEWGAQTPVTLALGLSALATALCLYLGLRRRPPRRDEIEFIPSPPRLDRAAWARTGWAPSIVAAATAVGTTALIAAPRTAVLAMVPALLVVVLRRPRVAALAAVVLMAYLGVQITLRQWASRYLANAAWPGMFADLHRPGMMVVALLLAGSIVTRPGEGRSD